MAGLDEKSGLGSQVGLMPGSVVSVNFIDIEFLVEKPLLNKSVAIQEVTYILSVLKLP